MDIATTSTTLLRVLGEDAQSARWTEFAAQYVPFMTDYLRAAFPTLEADDIVQEALIVVVKALPNYHYDPDAKGHFHNWLVGVVRNKANDALRKRAHDVAVVRRVAEKGVVEQQTPRTNDDWRRDAFESALAQLLCDPDISDRDRQVFRRVALNEESPESVATLFGITRNHVDQIKSRLKARLRETVERMLNV